MSITIPTQEPQSFTAGDTIQWSRNLGTFPATDGWTLYYVLRGPSTIKATAATYQTSNYLVTLAASATASYVAGLYSISAYVLSGTTRYSVPTWFPQVTILANPQTFVDGAYDNRTFAQITLANCEAALQALASRKVQSASVNGQSYGIQDITKLSALRNRMREEVAAQAAQINYSAGLGGANKVLVQFPPLYPQTLPNQIGQPPSQF